MTSSNTERAQKWRKLNPQKSKEYRKAYYRKKLEKDPEYYKRSYQNNQDARLLKTYGISVSDRLKLLENQKYQCPICKQVCENLEDYRYWPVDHDHNTGTIRGVLCIRCNTGLGMFQDSEDIVKNAVKYLRKYGKI